MSKKMKNGPTSGKSGKQVAPMTKEAAERIKRAAYGDPNSDQGFVKRAVEAAKENKK
mgnify:CR=1 FL=1